MGRVKVGGMQRHRLDIAEVQPMIQEVRVVSHHMLPEFPLARTREVEPRKRQPSPLFPLRPIDLRRAHPEGGHLSRTATLHQAPASVGASPTTTRKPIPDALQRACIAAKTAADNKGQDVKVLDLRELTPVFDYFVVATGASRRQVHTLVEEIDAALRAVGDERMSVTGYESSRWVVQDYGDVVCHVFDPETRGYYGLEQLWADAEEVDWEQELD
jgi:ribosome-associated protein